MHKIFERVHKIINSCAAIWYNMYEDHSKKGPISLKQTNLNFSLPGIAAGLPISRPLSIATGLVIMLCFAMAAARIGKKELTNNPPHRLLQAHRALATAFFTAPKGTAVRYDMHVYRENSQNAFENSQRISKA